MKLAEIVGYQLDMARCAAVRSLNRLLVNEHHHPPDTTALALVRERPGCNQTMLGRALAGNRSVGMKVASRLEEQGLLTRGAGADGRSKGLFLTPEGERTLDRLLALHAKAEEQLATHLDPREKKTLLRLLAKLQQAVADEEDSMLADEALKRPRHSRKARSVR